MYKRSKHFTFYNHGNNTTTIRVKTPLFAWSSHIFFYAFQLKERIPDSPAAVVLLELESRGSAVTQASSLLEAVAQTAPFHSPHPLDRLTGHVRKVSRRLVEPCYCTTHSSLSLSSSSSFLDFSIEQSRIHAALRTPLFHCLPCIPGIIYDVHTMLSHFSKTVQRDIRR